jgi:cytochrome c
MKHLVSALAAVAALVPAVAFADPGMDLAQKKNCLACHGLDKKIVGPSYKDVAAKYAKDKDAADKLAQKIIHGGSGTWGAIPMPPNAVTEDEAKTLAKWVLSVK